ncbi:MAG: hypothetical protein CMM77_02120 [Rhodospirillaceae bacterium]|nr:hypothetical protein [Magnetovibrio sp.]MAY65906.1 hypothetical protein [Rhodospirillaceae bacterium]
MLQSIRQKLAACLIGILAVFIATAGFEILELRKELNALDRAKQDIARGFDKVVPLNLLVKDIRFHVVQVQQWLTDISATRGLNGLNDGFDVAKEHRAAFEKAASDAKAIAGELNLTNIISAIESAEAAMPTYFQQGEAMAQAYIAGGAESGNKLMGNFDEAASAMTDAVSSISTQIEKIGKSTAADANRLMTKISADTADVIKGFLIAMSISIAIAVVLAVYLSRLIREPIDKLLVDLSIVADRDNTAALSLGQDRKDEFGPVVSSLQTLRAGLDDAAKLEARQKEMEAANLRERKDTMNRLAAQFESSVGGVVSHVGDAADKLSASSETMAAAADQAGSQASTVAAASEQAAANVQTVASAAEELSSSIQEISRQVSDSTRIASDAVSEIEQTTVRVQSLTEAANRIGEVVDLITDIAEQTNLLALNATIEAARAGDAGKGFAVVASEVKNLANQTAKATEEIGQQISGIQNATRESATAISGISTTIGRMNEITSSVAAAVEQQGAATAEIARNVEQASAGTRDVSSNIQGVTAAVSETADVSRQIQAAATELSSQSAQLKNSVSTFLAEVRGG